MSYGNSSHQPGAGEIRKIPRFQGIYTYAIKTGLRPKVSTLHIWYDNNLKKDHHNEILSERRKVL
jgi:hypothetical protein